MTPTPVLVLVMCVAVSLLPTRMLGLEAHPTPVQPRLSLTNYICNDPLSKKGHIWGYWISTYLFWRGHNTAPNRGGRVLRTRRRWWPRASITSKAECPGSMAGRQQASQRNSCEGRQDPGPRVLSLSYNLVPKLGTEVAMLPALDLMGLDKGASVGWRPAHLP